jgi:hypothetical protein
MSRFLPHSLADEKRVCSLARPGQRRASMAQRGGARFPDARSWQFPAGRPAAYDKSMAEPNGSRPVRWSLWLAAGMLFGLALGFAFGLARPRARS